MAVPPGDGQSALDVPVGREWSEQEEQVSILLVDDNRENLVALQAVLEPLGARLITAESGDQALRALLHEEIAVILLDVRMRGLDGLQTAQIIRARPRTRNIPIIFLTAQASDVEEIALAYASGAVDYVIKPYEPEILRAKVSVFVELRRERSERVRQSRARAEAEAVARTVRTLQILSDAALTHLELDGLVAEVLERVSTLFAADAACLFLRDENAPGLGVNASRGAALPVPEGGRVVFGEGLLGSLAAERRPARLQGEDVWHGLGVSEPDEDAVASLLVVPLVVDEHLLGLLMLGALQEDRFEGGDLELLALAADRIAIAVDRVQRFAHGRQLVETLQRSLLPERLPHHPSLELAARYLPSGLAPQIGGDWYDALELGGDRTAVMIGDVVGHGVRAATTMSELRNALRALAVEGHSPGAALHQLDRVVHVTFGRGMLATVLFVVIDSRRGVVTLARAGHPPPAVRGVDGSVRYLDGGGTLPLGVDDRFTPTESEHVLEPGETLLLYTDGLIERRREAITAGFDRLRDALASAPSDAEGLCAHVLAETTAAEESHDDVAVLAVRLLAPMPGPFELTLPAMPESVTRARHRLVAWLRVNAPTADRGFVGDLELAWSEACTNVVRHAYGPGDASFQVGAAVEGSDIVLTVRDFGSWRPARGEHGGRGLSLMGMLSDEVEVIRGDEGTTVVMRRALPAAGADGAAGAA